MTGTGETMRAWRGLLFLLLSAATGLFCTDSAFAQTYPSRPIKIVVPFPPGGPTDVMARLIVQAMSSRLGQSVIIENQSGAGGRSGSKAVAGAAPDGYTLLVGGTNMNAIIPALYHNLGYDPVKGFAAVASIASDAGVMVAGPSTTAATLLEFIRYAKDNPGKLKYGTAPGLGSHLSAELLKQKTATDIMYIPYKGGAPAITDLMGGQIDMVFNNKSVLLALIQERKLRALGVTSAVRWRELPDVPTLAENGLDGFPADSWYGLVAPVGTPAAVIDKLNAAVNDGLNSPELRASLTKLGIEARANTPQKFAEALADQAVKYDAIVKSTGIKVE
jgi:tripartite-type tricarboxylate transporter receptor subunit TctC